MNNNLEAAFFTSPNIPYKILGPPDQSHSSLHFLSQRGHLSPTILGKCPSPRIHQRVVLVFSFAVRLWSVLSIYLQAERSGLDTTNQGRKFLQKDMFENNIYESSSGSLKNKSDATLTQLFSNKKQIYLKKHRLIKFIPQQTPL